VAGFRAACVQMRSGLAPETNVPAALELIGEAAGRGAALILTPEMTHALDQNPKRLFGHIDVEDKTAALGAFCDAARAHGAWLGIGSLAIKLEERRAANRSYLISPDGEIAARYDKAHMFDVDLPGGESYRESNVYKRGETAVAAETPLGRLGLTVCYDVRFPHLYRRLAQSGAQMIAVPAAFTRQTGAAHWEVLLRARAIETGAFVLAAAQGGRHEDGRETYGHSLIVDPWGEVLAEAGDDDPGVIVAEIDLAQVERARARIPAWRLDLPLHSRTFASQ